MRKHYIDNIRIMIILMLIPYHTFMIWNNYGTKFYVWGGNNNILSTLIVLVAPWFMPILFVIAGISTRYSLKKRSTKAYIKERIQKLLVPFICGTILLVPFQTLFARKFFYNYDGSIIENYKYFFTHFSDLNGYDGMFTFGHLWFLLYLFVIALLSLIIIKNVPFDKVEKKIDKINIIFILLMFIPLFIFYNIGNFGGQSIGKYILLYLLGYYLFTDSFIDKLLKYKKLLISFFIISEVILGITYYYHGFYNDLYVNFVGWIGILSCIIIGKLFLNRENKITNYLKKASFSIYILHQTILIIIGYYTLLNINNIFISLSIIIFGSFISTILFYEIIARIPYLRKIIGIK